MGGPSKRSAAGKLKFRQTRELGEKQSQGGSVEVEKTNQELLCKYGQFLKTTTKRT
jgi:hypothetical protein